MQIGSVLKLIKINVERSVHTWRESKFAHEIIASDQKFAGRFCKKLNTLQPERHFKDEFLMTSYLARSIYERAFKQGIQSLQVRSARSFIE